MKNYIDEVWVTSACSNEDVKNCLVLVNSLKISATTRPIAVFISSHLETSIRSTLNHFFDHVFSLEQDMLGNEDSYFHSIPALHQLAKVSIFKLHAFEKCVYLPPTSLVLRNADSIFDFGETQIGDQVEVVLPDKCFVCEGGMPYSQIFGARPSLEYYNAILRSWLNEKESLEKIMRNFFLEESIPVGYLDEVFCATVDAHGYSINSSDVAIVNFMEDPLTLDENEIGILEKIAVNLWRKLDNEKDSLVGEYAREPIAIVGMSCRYPNSNNLQEFWKVLIEGKDCISLPPLSRSKTGLQQKVPGGFLDIPVDEFDAKFFGISPNELIQMDPQHRLLHEVMWEALEDAGLNPTSLNSTNGGIFVGTWKNDFNEVLVEKGYKGFYRKYMGNSIGAGASRLSFNLGLTGPCIATESGCSSSMVAVHLACQSLFLNETNMAVACGANLILNPLARDDLPMMLAPDGKCKTLDAKADGFGRAEGLGVLVLKRLSDAVRDNDKIWALIRGSAVAQEGITKSLGTPTVRCETMVMKQALKEARLKPEQVSYLEMHGTGTPTGDPIEVRAITNAYFSKERKQPLVIGSVKTNVGHTESCSGITGMMKVVLQMKHGIIAPHRNLEKLNPEINLDLIPAKVSLEPEKWRRGVGGRRRIAGVSSFGITGTDAHLLLEEPPQKMRGFVTDFMRPLNILKISAKSEEAFNLLIGRYLERLKLVSGEKEEDTLENICYTGNVGRADFQFRSCLIAGTKEEMISSFQKGLVVKKRIPDEPPKVCFLFTGQGSQYPGMAKDLYETSPVFRLHFDYCAKILETKFKINIHDVVVCPDNVIIHRSIYSQTSIFVVEYALFKLWESWGVTPDFCLGHSLGEFAATVCAGILSVEDALTLVASRILLIEAKCPPGQMLVVNSDKSTVEEKMSRFSSGDASKILDFAAFNSKDQTVVSGNSGVVQEFRDYLKMEGKSKSTLLQATHAFHSKDMDVIREDYERTANSMKTADSSNWKCRYISGVHGCLIQNASEIDANYWWDHCRNPVNFLEASKTVSAIVDPSTILFLEIGPQPILSALQMINSGTVSDTMTCLPSLKRTEPNWTTMLGSLKTLYTSGVEVNWDGFDKLYERTKVTLPTYPFIRKVYWPQEMNNLSNTKVLHPLLGVRIANATSRSIFQASLNLSDIEYVKHHQIGENIIYPAACFIEMLIGAGVASLGEVPMKLENVVINSPLRLIEGVATNVQTITSEDGRVNGIQGKIFRMEPTSGGEEDEESFTFHQHVQSTILPLSSEEEKRFSNMDLESFESTKHSPSDDDFISEFYSRLDSFGWKFGEKFQSLEKVWRGNVDDGVLNLVKIKLAPTDNNYHYINHPVVIDAMIQAIIALDNSESLKKKAHLPVRIGEFVCLPRNKDSKIDENLYVYMYNSSSAVLLESTGTPLAIMSEVEFIGATVSALNSVLERQNSKLPTLWEEVWKRVRGSMEDRLNLETIPEQFFDQEFLSLCHSNCNLLRERNLQTWNLLQKFVFFNMLKALYDCGWKGANKDEVVCLETLVKTLGILEKHSKVVDFYLNVLEEEGFLKKEVQGGRWKVISALPTYSDLLGELMSPNFSKDLVQLFPSTGLLTAIGDKLGNILRGESTALEILFPDRLQKYPSVHQFYEESFEIIQGVDLCSLIVSERIKFWKKSSQKDANFVLRILEVGAGTGGYTKRYLNLLEAAGIEYELHYTDISPGFFLAAEKKFENYKDKIRFQKLNIEEDPLDQGFLPEYFDYVVANEVIHATRDIRQSLGNVWKVLRDSGSFDIFEQTKVNRVATFVFGCLDGFWRFEDFDLRRGHCVMPAEKWRRALEQSGYSFTQVFHCCDGYQGYICAQKRKHLEILQRKEVLEHNNQNVWLILKPGCQNTLIDDLLEKLSNPCQRSVVLVERGTKFEETGTNQFSVRGEMKDDFHKLMRAVGSTSRVEGIIYAWPLDWNQVSQEELLLPYLNIIQSLSSLKDEVNWPRCLILTDGVSGMDAKSEINFHQSTLWGFAKSQKSENVDQVCRCIDVNNADSSEILHELWNGDNETQVIFNDHSKLVPRLRQLKPSSSHSSLSLPRGTHRFQLVLPASRQISDLTFAPLHSFNELHDNQVEVEIRAAGLNFRDIFAILKPTEYFHSLNSIGIDVAGVVTRAGRSVTKWNVGDRVYWVPEDSNVGSLPSHRLAEEDDLERIPDGISFVEAATGPCVFATAYASLVEVANVKADDRILVHTASGGVGLCCIELCRILGVSPENIICTAGTLRKRNFLRKSYGIVNVFNSRSTEYSDKILELTGGRGVDVVVNTLTNKGFKEATLHCLGKNGRFVELSKLNVWTETDVVEMRHDVKYHVVDITSISKQHNSELIRKYTTLLGKKTLRPLPHTRFDAADIRQALDFLQNAKHIGKVVCVMPEFKFDELEGKSMHTPMFSSNATYLITGGLGGIGFEVAKWILRRGGKNLVLLGRRSPTAEVKREIQKLIEVGTSGIRIETAAVDVSNYSELKNLIQNFESMGLPPLKGVMHCAGILADGVIPSFEWSTFSSPFKSKIAGTLNLHRVTTELDSRLEYFVLFSSIAALFGALVQSNHAAGNRFEDAFAHYRHSIGLPATTVNWGVWTEVGIAKQIDLPGMKGISTEQGLAALEYALKSQRVQTCALNIGSYEKLTWRFPQAAIYLEAKGLRGGDSEDPDDHTKPATSTESKNFWGKYQEADNIVAKRRLVEKEVELRLKGILKISDEENIRSDESFAILGLDSLMYIELRNAIQSLLGSRALLNVAEVREMDSLKELSSSLINLLEGVQTPEIKEMKPSKTTFEEMRTMLEDDCKLPEEIRAKEEQVITPIQDVACVLLTGATGTLGPYVLRELSNLPQIVRIYCLVRSHKMKTAADRLNDCLNGKQLLESIQMSKVKIVEGDVALPWLGISDDSWKVLTNSCDAVIHCAAKVDHVEYFSEKKNGNKRQSVRDVNILGTKNVLKFAICGGKLKQLYYASSLFACGRGRKPNGRLIECWPSLRDFEDVTIFSYPISKFCADMLVKEACEERGIPCKSFRFPLVTGDSISGQFTIDQNHFMLRYFYMMKTGIMPNLPFPLQLLPVDICARVSVQLFFNAEAPPDLYNIAHPSPNTDEEFITLANKFGKKIRTVDFAQFSETLRLERDDSSQITLFKEMYNDDEVYLKQYNASLNGWMERREDFWRSEKLDKYMPGFQSSLKTSLEYMEQDLKFAKDQGWFDRFGL